MQPCNRILLQDCIFFFFYWRYNPLWVLAFSVIFFHSALSSLWFLHRLSLIICKSSMPAIHLFLGLSLILVPICFHCNIPLGVLLSSIRITWPSHTKLHLGGYFYWRQILFSSPLRPERLWSPPWPHSVDSRVFSRWKSGQNVRLATRHLVSRFRMSGVVPLPPPAMYFYDVERENFAFILLLSRLG